MTNQSEYSLPSRARQEAPCHQRLIGPVWHPGKPPARAQRIAAALEGAMAKNHRARMEIQAVVHFPCNNGKIISPVTLFLLYQMGMIITLPKVRNSCLCHRVRSVAFGPCYLTSFSQALDKGTSQEWSRMSCRQRISAGRRINGCPSMAPPETKQMHKLKLFEPQTKHSPKLSHQRQCRCNPTTLDPQLAWRHCC